MLYYYTQHATYTIDTYMLESPEINMNFVKRKKNDGKTEIYVHVKSLLQTTVYLLHLSQRNKYYID